MDEFCFPFRNEPFLSRIETAAARGGWILSPLTSAPDPRRVWLRRPAPQPGAPRLYLSAGIHGDEAAGPNTILRLLETDGFSPGIEWFVFPCLNPAGLEQGTRENPEGIDLNRDYRKPRTREIREHLAILQTLPRFEVNVCMHEDWEFGGAYLYELRNTETPGCGRELLQAMEPFLPIEQATLIDDFAADRGLITRPKSAINRPDWPEALYLGTYLTDLGYTLETPSSLPLSQRVAAQTAALQQLATWLLQNAQSPNKIA
jgi:protein MpaA